MFSLPVLRDMPQKAENTENQVNSLYTRLAAILAPVSHNRTSKFEERNKRRLGVEETEFPFLQLLQFLKIL